ncbi:MAG: PAS domain S-box protein [Candidatus Omnitrophica bacterium]|nr:PAS domain S-box protein [Candidatus Omnitrophota bacterium]
MDQPLAAATSLTAFAAFGLALAVVIRERASVVSLLFLLMSATIGWWLFAFSHMYGAADVDMALWWAKTAYLTIPLIPVAVSHFAAVSLGMYRENRVILWLGWFLAVSFASAIVSTDALIGGLYQYRWGYYPRYGWLSVSYLTFFFGMLVMSLRLYWVEYRQARPGTARWQRSRTFLGAFGILYLGTWDYLAKFGLPAYPFGYVPVLIFLGLVARAIWRYRLVDLTPQFATSQILETMNGGVLVVDMEGDVRVANRAVSELLGYSPAELIGQPITRLFETSLERAMPMAHLTEQAIIRDREMVCRTKPGEPVDVSVSAATIMDPRGTRAGTVYVLLDITERKLIQHALRTSEERLRAVVESAQDAIISADHAGNMIAWNKGAEAMFGYAPQEALGQPLTLLMPQRFHEAHQQGFNRFLKTGEARVMGRTIELAGQRKNGMEFPLELSLASWMTQEGRFVTAIIRDITERKRAAIQLEQTNTLLKEQQEELLQTLAKYRRANQELQEAQLRLIQAAKFESVGRLAAGVAHEVKNPLAIMVMGIDYLSRHVQGNGPHVGVVLQDLNQAAWRADRVIKGLLDFSAPTEVNLEAGDLNATIEQALLLVRHALDKQHVRVATSFEPRLPMVRRDQTKLEQVFVNLFMNSIDAMPEGGTLSIRTYQTTLPEASDGVGHRDTGVFAAGDAVVMVEVDDTGVGIPDVHLLKLFDPFFTTKPTGKGTGLGLAVTKTIIRLHGGMITVKNRPEGGARATIVLKADHDEGGDGRWAKNGS